MAIDWTALEAERDSYLLRHKRFAEAMDIALAHIPPLDLASLDEPEFDDPCIYEWPGPDEDAICPHCHGMGWRWASDDRRPWRDVKTECECAI